MAKNYIIYLPEIGQELAHWALADDNGKLQSRPVSGTLAEAAKAVEGRRSTLVLAGDNVLLADASVPGGSVSRAPQAIPAQLEDQVADDIEKLHFAIGSRVGDDTFPVAVIGRDAMRELKEQLQSANLRPSEVVPETLAIPKLESKDKQPVWTALVDKDHTVVRLNGYKGFASDNDTARFILDGAWRELEDQNSQGMIVFHTEGSQTEPLLENLQVENRPCESPLHVFAAGLARSPRINLLQGEFSLRQQLGNAWKPWRWTFVLAGVLLAALAGRSVVDYWRLGQQESALQSLHEQTFAEAVPGVPMRGNGVAQVKERLARLGSLSGGGAFTQAMGQITRALGTLENTEVHAIGYRNDRFDIDVSVADVPALDTLKNAMESDGTLAMTVQSTNRQGGSVRSRIRVELK